MTNGEAVYDLLERLGQGSDDDDIGYRLASQWIDIARQMVFKKYIDENGEDIPPSLLHRYECVAVECVDSDCEGCRRCTLVLPNGFDGDPIDIMDIDADLGVYQVFLPGGKELDRYSGPGEASILGRTRFANSHYWFRIGREIYVNGAFPADIKFEVLLIVGSIMSLDPDDEFPAPGEVIIDILDEAEKIGRRMIATPRDITNDGKSLPNGR